MIKRLYPLLLLPLLIGLIGCGDDNATGPDDEERPALPEIQNAQPDLSFFDNNTSTSEDTAFTQAQAQVMSANLLIAQGQAYSSYIEMASGEDATYEDGSWIWNYNYSGDGITVDIELTAQEQDNATTWAMFWTFDDGQGRSFEDYRIMEGTIRNDGSEGDWTFNALGDNDEVNPAYTSSWRVISDTEETVTLELYDQESLVATLNYEKNEPEHTLTYNFEGDQEDVTIFWNTDTGNGYLSQGDSQQCWDENFQDTSCS